MTNRFLYRRKKLRKKKAYSNESKPLRQIKFKNVHTIIVGQERTISFFVIKKVLISLNKLYRPKWGLKSLTLTFVMLCPIHPSIFILMKLEYFCQLLHNLPPTPKTTTYSQNYHLLLCQPSTCPWSRWCRWGKVSRSASFRTSKLLTSCCNS